MSKKIVAYIKSMRLRTLPLSISGSLMGIMLANSDHKLSAIVCTFIIMTTILLQILSNLANELGDVINGTDTEDRQGPQYGLNSGTLSINEMKKCIYLFSFLGIISGIIMLILSFGTLFCMESLILLIIGLSAIISGLRYTLGRNPYGYRGMGDIFVFTYFGIVSVLGSYFVACHEITNYYIILPAVSIGLFSVGVLNINNLRDIKSDSKTRITIAIKLGVPKARIYQTILLVGGWISMLLYCNFRFSDPWHYLYLISLPGFIYVLYLVWTREDKKLDPALPALTISTFIFAILTGIGFNIFLI